MGDSQVAATEPSVYQFKISLEDLEPPVWRRVLVPGNLSVHDFHKVILCLFGWDGTQLQKFNFPDTERTSNSCKGVETGRRPISSCFKLGVTVVCPYDSRTEWTHYIKLEGILPMNPDVTYPRCTAGRRPNLGEDTASAKGDGPDFCLRFKPSAVDFSRMAQLDD